jgi:hypothetical protein
MYRWQPKTSRDTLAVLAAAGIALPGLEAGMEKLQEVVDLLDD